MTVLQHIGLHRLSWTLALIASLCWASWKGGRDERFTVAVLALADLAALLSPASGDVGAHLISATLDGILLAYFAYRSAVTSRWWPLYACAAQLGVCVGALAFTIDSQPLVHTYRSFAAVWSYAIILSLATGTWLEQARVREDHDKVKRDRISRRAGDPPVLSVRG